VEEIISKFVGEWGWITAVAIVTFAFKDLVSNFVIGAQFLLGNDYNIDDIVYIRGAKKARIVRQSIWKTVFYVYGHDRKFIVPNNMLWRLEIEKEIPQNETH
jgi:small-conductance mechanosensitive channel|tara:strand:- start:179 stop:484 length:306 start_codon:yes stop_codon:yes gene_type:complete